MVKQYATVVYDHQCPVCRAYCESMEARHPETTYLLDARKDSELMREITRQGFDIDEGMVVEMSGKLFFGARAIHILANREGTDTWFDRINRLLFRRLSVAKVWYPLLKALRNLLLRVLRVERINNLERPKQ